MGDAIEPTNVQTGAEAASGSNLPATTSDRPATFGGMLLGILNFITLSVRFAMLAAAAMWLKENLHILKARMHKDAEFARRVAELCGAARVDDYFVALFLEAAQAFDRVAEASGELAGAADGMEAGARAVGDAHETEYRGVYEVRQASPYAQPTPGFNKVR